MKKWKKSIIASCLAVGVLFLAAFGVCVQALQRPQTVSASQGEMKIVLDAGHGGIDGGVTGVVSRQKESDINLAITFALQKELKDRGFAVALTRKTSEGLYDTTARGFKKRDMQKRKEIIEREKPLLVLSIHQNFYASQKERGGQVFYGDNHLKSKVLATLLQNSINGLYEKEGVKGRKIQKGEYFMLQCYHVPAVIVECGFLSSPKDESLLISESWQKSLAKVLADGVLEYFIEQSA